MGILRKPKVKGARSSSVNMMPETGPLSMLPYQPISVQRSRSEVVKKVNTMKERNKVASPTSNPSSAPPHLQRTAHPVRKRRFQQGGSMTLEEFKSLQRKLHPVISTSVMDVINAPQKAMTYGVTTLTRGVGDGVYDTPGNVIKNDWKSFNNRGTQLAANVLLDPLNALPAATFYKSMSGMKSVLPFVKNTSALTGRLYNKITNAVDGINAIDNVITSFK